MTELNFHMRLIDPISTAYIYCNAKPIIVHCDFFSRLQRICRAKMVVNTTKLAGPQCVWIQKRLISYVSFIKSYIQGKCLHLCCFSVRLWRIIFKWSYVTSHSRCCPMRLYWKQFDFRCFTHFEDLSEFNVFVFVAFPCGSNE